MSIGRVGFALGMASMLTGCATRPAPGGPAPLAAALRSDVETLAGRIGERNCYHPDKLEEAAAWIEAQFAATGLKTRRLPVEVPAGEPYCCGKMTVWNIEAEKPGSTLPDELLVIGAHYDSKVAMRGWHDHKGPLPGLPGTPGADDNASGVAVMLALARHFAQVPTRRSLRFVAFVNEEPPFYQTDAMGSLVYARSLVQDKSRRVLGMFTPDSVGCYSKQPNRKRVWLAGPLGLPAKPDYVAFMSDLSSRSFNLAAAAAFRRSCQVKLRPFVLPALAPRVAWSDDWAFWRQGVPAFTVTDTAFLRYDHYHETTDTPRLARLRRHGRGDAGASGHVGGAGQSRQIIFT